MSLDHFIDKLNINKEEKNKLKVILSPSAPKRCSILLKRTNAPITYLDGIKDKVFLNKKEKAPDKDEP